MQRNPLLSLMGVIAIMSFGACSGSKSPKDITPPTAPWSLTFSDGNANNTRFWQKSAAAEARFEYTPITPAASSSGNYSDGAPREGTVTPAQIHALWQWVARLENETKQHSPTRKMGTGAFKVQAEGDTRRFIVKGGELLASFENSLRPYKGVLSQPEPKPDATPEPPTQPVPAPNK